MCYYKWWNETEMKMCTTSSAQRPLCSGKRVLDVEDRASGKQSSIIAEAVAYSMCTVIDKYMEKDKVEPKIKEEDETEKLFTKKTLGQQLPIIRGNSLANSLV